MMKILKVVMLCGCVLFNYAPLGNNSQLLGNVTQSADGEKSKFDQIAEKMGKKQALGRVLSALKTEDDIVRLVSNIEKDENMLLELQSAIENNEDAEIMSNFITKLKGKSGRIDSLLPKELSSLPSESLETTKIDLKSFFSYEKNWSRDPEAFESELKTYLESDSKDLDDVIISYIKHADIMKVMSLKSLVADISDKASDRFDVLMDKSQS